MLLDLPQNSEALWAGFKSKLRSQINRSDKNGLIFTWGNSDTLKQFYSVFSANMRELGSPQSMARVGYKLFCAITGIRHGWA